MELKEGIKQINQSVTQSSASDATLEGYMLELKDANGNLVDKQPVSKLENLVYNYLTTKRTGELATAVGRTKDFETEFGYNRGINFQRQSEPDTFFKINYNMCAQYGGAAGFVADIHIGLSHHPVDIYKFAIAKTTGGTKFSVYGNMSSIYPSNFYHDANNNIYINIKFGGDNRVIPIVGSVSSIELIGTTPPEGLTEIPLSNAYVSYMKDYPNIASLASGIRPQTIKNGGSERIYKIGVIPQGYNPFCYNFWVAGTNAGKPVECTLIVGDEGAGKGLADNVVMYKDWGAGEIGVSNFIEIAVVTRTVYLVCKADVSITFGEYAEEATGVDLSSAYNVPFKKIPTFYKNYNSLSELKDALKAIW